MRDWTKVDWRSPQSKVSDHFTVGEALLLRQWRLTADPSWLTVPVMQSICRTAAWLDQVRGIVGKPLLIRSWWRPSAYNAAIGGATRSAHLTGNAVDFWTDQDGDGKMTGQDCDALKELLMPHLEPLGLRMEDNGVGARWVHLDDRPVLPGGHRFFKP